MSAAIRHPQWPTIAMRVAAIVIPGILFAAGFRMALGWLIDDARTTQFPRTEGVVTVSEFKPGAGGGRYDWALEYTYTVAGTTYMGTRYSPAGGGWYYERDAGRMAAAFPVGARVPVAYDPDAPAVAYLRPGQPGQLFERAMLVLIAVGLAGGYVAIAVSAPSDGSDPAPLPREFDPAAPRQVTHAPDGVRVRLPAESLIHLVLGVLLAGGLGVLIFRTRPTPPDPYPGWVGFLIAVAVPLLVSVLTIPFRRTTVLLEAARPRFVIRRGRLWPPPVVPFDRVVGIQSYPHTYSGKGGPITYHRVAVLRAVPGDVREVVLTEYLNKFDADALAAWLRNRLGLPVPGSMNSDNSSRVRS
jgi:hypothetical protein